MSRIIIKHMPNQSGYLVSWMQEKFSANDMADLFRYHDQPTGYRTRVHTVTYMAEDCRSDMGTIVCKGAIESADHLKAGYFVRELNAERDEGQVYFTEAYHTTLYLKPQARSKGFGSRFLAACQERYIDHGIPLIRIQAGDVNGAYTWARLGFSPSHYDIPLWKDGERVRLERMVENARRSRAISGKIACQAHGILGENTPRPDMNAIATLGKRSTWRDSKGRHLGKALLMNAEWPGQMRIRKPIS